MLPMSTFHSGGPSKILLPYHHTVSDEKLAHIYHLYQYKNVRQFSDDIDFLLKHYKPIDVNQLYQAVKNGNTIPKGSFLLSFDDGFREVNDIIAPILEKKGVPAVFFINPAFIDNQHLFYRCKISILIGELKANKNYLQPFSEALQLANVSMESIIVSLKNVDQHNAAVLDSIAERIGYSFNNYLRSQLPFLTKEELLSLHNKGFSIGAHSMNHPYYKLISVKEQASQTIDSCNYVKNITGTTECHFSFPHSDKDVKQNTIDLIIAGNEGLLFGIQNQKEELHNKIFHRFNAERPETNIEELIKGQITLNRLQKLTGRNTVKRK